VLVALVLSRLRTGDGPTIRLRDLRQAISELHSKGKDASFLVVIPPATAKGEDALNLQLSIEKGRLGLDWVLISKVNIADRGRFETFVKGQGLVARLHVMNGVSYLRVEDGDLAALAEGVLTNLHGLAPDSTLETILEGFTLGPGRP